MLSSGIRLSSHAYAPTCISHHMQQCWKETPDERPSFCSFLQTLENMYEFKASIDSASINGHANYASRVKMRYLKYASLAFHEDSVENRFRQIKNLR